MDASAKRRLEFVFLLLAIGAAGYVSNQLWSKSPYKGK